MRSAAGVILSREDGEGSLQNEEFRTKNFEWNRDWTTGVSFVLHEAFHRRAKERPFVGSQYVENRFRDFSGIVLIADRKN